MKENNLKNIKTMGYGIIKYEDLPDFKYEDKKLDLSGIHWAEMRKFSDIAKNHCGPTFITNLAIYFESKGYTGLLIDGDVRKTFEHVHKMTGNGPVVMTARTAKKYFAQRGYKLKYSIVDSFEEIKEAIDQGKPLSLLVMEHLFSWHWVMGVGYLDSDKYDFVRIINAWEDTPERFYLVNQGAVFMSARKYEILGKI